MRLADEQLAIMRDYYDRADVLRGAVDLWVKDLLDTVDALRAERDRAVAERDAALTQLADAERAGATVARLSADQLSEAVARAEAAEAERDAANALGAETTVQLKSAQYHLGVMVKAWEAAEARIAAALKEHTPFGPVGTACPTCRSGVKYDGLGRCPTRAALAEPVEPISLVGFAVGEPQPSACATCGGEKWVDDPTWALADELPPYVPCPSCTPPDHAPHRGAEIDCCEDDPDAWFAVCPECGWQSPQGRSRHEVATALAHHQANPAAPPDRTPAPPDPESETP